MLVNADLQSIAAYGDRHSQEYGGCEYSLAELRDVQAAIARADLRTDAEGRLVTDGVI